MTGVVTARHAAFRALLAALAMPGTRHRVPGADPLALLLDAIYVDVEAALASGAVAVVASVLSPQTIESAPRGEEMQPEAGATLYLQIDERTPWTRVKLSGPGVRGAIDVGIPLSREALDARARACASYPRGIDIVAIDRDATVIAFPRTTRIEACPERSRGAA